MRESKNTFDQAYATVQALQAEVSRSVYIVKEDLLATIGALAIEETGHVLFDGGPGTGKTHLARAIAAAIGGKFGRVQGTPDVMPPDITGTDIYHPGKQSFDFLPGPIFSNVFLLDEGNRLSTKSQSALLEAMQEGQVTTRGETRPLPKPFVVIATQNPLEIGQGVNPFTKAGRDRFGIGIHMPEHDVDAMLAVDHLSELGHTPGTVVDLSDITQMHEAAKAVVIDDKLKRTAARMVVAARTHGDVDIEDTVLGGSRAYNNIRDLARFSALAEQRQNVELKDVKFAAPYVLSHRMEVNSKAAEQNITVHNIVSEVISETR